MLITLICFLLIFGTHCLLGKRVSANKWNLWQTLAIVLAVIAVSLPVSIIIGNLLPTIFFSVVMAVILQQKFMAQRQQF